LHFRDLQQRVGIAEEPTKEKPTESPEMILLKKESQIEERKERSPNVFVVMPLSSDLDDLYYLGILETARDLNCSCDRVDEIEFVGNIMAKVHESIINSKVIIAEVSSSNPNVYYEVGYAHALRKPVILITKDVSSAPFDSSGYNHIVHRSIRDLRQKLKNRLEAILSS